MTPVTAKIEREANIGRAEEIGRFCAADPATKARTTMTTPTKINGSHRFIPACDERRSANQNANIEIALPSVKPWMTGPTYGDISEPKTEMLWKLLRNPLNCSVYSMIV